MKTPVHKLDEELVPKTFSNRRPLRGWYFRLFERSNGCWCVEGTDLWGRTVGDVGDDEDRALASCIAMATEINRQSATKAG